MLTESLIISSLHLLLVGWLAYRKSDTFAFFVLALLPLIFCALLFSSALLYQAIALAILVLLWRRFTPNYPSIYVATSIVAVIAIYIGVAWQTTSMHQDLLARYPMESMAQRAPTPKNGKPITEVSESKAWASFEANLSVELEWNDAKFWSRSQRLRNLHENTTRVFVSSPGFGLGRMDSTVVRPEQFESGFEPAKPILQPDADHSPVFSTEIIEKPDIPRSREGLSRLHFLGLADFVNVQGFGYFKGREQVAGFRSHEFSRLPEVESFRVKRLELVSLLMQGKPAVYVSKELPRMKDLKNSRTRNLSEFETKGLLALDDGDDLFVRETDEGLLMLGSIRSVEQCVKCHGGERGDLLGAFSYSLTRISDK